MEKIEFYPSTHTPEESDSLTSHVQDTFKGVKEDDADLQTTLNELSTEKRILSLSVSSSSVNIYKEQFEESVLKRDLIFTGGRYSVKAFTYWIFDPEIKEAAEKLQKVVTRHAKDFNGGGYEKQNSVVSSFILELSTPEMQACLLKLGLILWFSELVNSCEQTEEVYYKKLEYKNGKESIAKKDAQVKVNEKLKKLFAFLEFRATYDNDPVWVQLYDNVRGIVNQMNTVSRIRRGHKNNNSSDEGDAE